MDIRGGDLDKECARRILLPPSGVVGTTFVAVDEEEDVDIESLVVAVLVAVLATVDDDDEE